MEKFQAGFGHKTYSKTDPTSTAVKPAEEQESFSFHFTVVHYFVLVCRVLKPFPLHFPLEVALNPDL